MFNRKILLLASAFSFWALGAQADTTCVKQDCAALGYTKTLAQCSGADNIIKCPFDTSKVACNKIIRSPIFDILYNYVFNVCDIEYGLDADISCLTDGYDQEMLCADLTGLDLNMDISNCLNSSDADPASISTMQDLLNAVENILIAKVDPCAGAVEYDPEWQTCSNTCDISGQHLCFDTPQTISCATAIANAGGIELNSYTSVNAGYKYYLTDNVTISSIYYKNGTFMFYRAAALKPCAHMSSINLNPTLTIDNLSVPEGGENETTFNGQFYVKTIINRLGYMNNKEVASLSFLKGGSIGRAEVPASGYASLLIYAPVDQTVTAKLMCDADSTSDYNTCKVSFEGDTATYFNYCNMDSLVTVDCVYGSCTQVSCSSI